MNQSLASLKSAKNLWAPNIDVQVLNAALVDLPYCSSDTTTHSTSLLNPYFITFEVIKIGILKNNNLSDIICTEENEIIFFSFWSESKDPQVPITVINS